MADAVLDESTIYRLSGAADEALQNALVHGNLEVASALRDSGDGSFDDLVEQRRTQTPFCDRQIDFTMIVDDEAVTITVTDQGPGFDPEAVPDPREPEYCERGHGRGLLMMRAFADEVRYNARGNEVTLVVQRPCLCDSACG